MISSEIQAEAIQTGYFLNHRACFRNGHVTQFGLIIHGKKFPQDLWGKPSSPLQRALWNNWMHGSTDTTIIAIVRLWGEQSKNEAESVAEEVKRKETVLEWDNSQVYSKSEVQVITANKFPYCAIFLVVLLFVVIDNIADWENQSEEWYFKTKLITTKKPKQLKENTVKDYIHWVGEAVVSKYSVQLHSGVGVSSSNSSFLRLFMHRNPRSSLKNSPYISIKDYKGLNSFKGIQVKRLKAWMSSCQQYPTQRLPLCHQIPTLYLLLLRI